MSAHISHNASIFARMGLDLALHCFTWPTRPIGIRRCHAQALFAMLAGRCALRAAFFIFVSVNVTVAGSLCWGCVAHAISPAAAVRTFGLLGAGATFGASHNWLGRLL